MDGFFVRVNRQWENTLGYTAEELEGKMFMEYVHPEDIESTVSTMKTLSNQISVIDFVNRYKAK